MYKETITNTDTNFQYRLEIIVAVEASKAKLCKKLHDKIKVYKLKLISCLF